jgi:asparagine synthase (glutamine-hydrolysing)
VCGILALTGVAQPFHHGLLRGLRRRGPDGIGFWSDHAVDIGHARLAIIGLDERGAQPLESATHVLAYNGEIYNFNAIAQRLRAAGVAVAGSSDAEVLLQAWGHWGPDILRELEGFWAFVIYDKARRRLSLVRDQFGVKPLYYWRSKGRLCVSSLIGTILGAVGEAPELDYDAMSEYVRYQFTFGDKTFVKQIRKVPPGHIVEIDVDSGQTRTSCYEDIFAPAGGPREAPTSEWIAQTRDLLAECVVDSTISDTPFTTFCSGGLDSSLITRIARPEIAYHCNYSDPECNETFFAQQVVQGTGIRLFVVNAQESFDLVARLADIVEDFDELSIGSVILPLDDLLAQVKRRYKVILTGTGGDELFAGYARYQLALGECYQDSYRGLYQRMREIASVPDRFEFTHRKGDPSLYRFYRSEVEKTFAAAYEACRSRDDELETMLRFDRRHFLEGLLNIDDKLSGRHSLESRPSLLHQRLVRRVLEVGTATFMRNGDLKPVLRELAAGRVPRPVIHRNDKMGFTTPIGTFVNRASHLIRERLMDSRFRHLYDLRRLNLTAETKFSREVFGLLMLDLWLNRYAVR